MLYALCLRLGCPHPDFLLEVLNAPQLLGWLRYHERSPVDDSRADLHAGIMASVMANAHRAERAKPFSPLDFMPFAERPKVDARAALKAMFADKVVKKNG